jgi:hypothetical protein
MDGVSAVSALSQTAGYATLLIPTSIHNFRIYLSVKVEVGLSQKPGALTRCRDK